MGRLYYNSDGFLMLCVKTNINLSKSNFDRICDDVGIISSEAPFDDLSPINNAK